MLKWTAFDLLAAFHNANIGGRRRGNQKKFWTKKLFRHLAMLARRLNFAFSRGLSCNVISPDGTTAQSDKRIRLSLSLRRNIFEYLYSPDSFSLKVRYLGRERDVSGSSAEEQFKRLQDDLSAMKDMIFKSKTFIIMHQFYFIEFTFACTCKEIIALNSKSFKVMLYD